MDFAVIAAGKGSRLKQEGIDLPKPLVKINEVPLIKRTFDIADNFIFENYFCIINEEEKEVENFTRKLKTELDINLVVKSTKSSLHSVYELSRRIKNKDFVLSTVDTILSKEDYSRFINEAENCSSDVLLSLTEYIDDEKPLCVDVDENMRITEFSDSKSGYIYATGGIYFFSKSTHKEIETAVNEGTNRLRNLFRHLLKNGFSLRGIVLDKIIDVDHKTDIQKAEKIVE